MKPNLASRIPWLPYPRMVTWLSDPRRKPGRAARVVAGTGCLDAADVLLGQWPGLSLTSGTPNSGQGVSLVLDPQMGEDRHRWTWTGRRVEIQAGSPRALARAARQVVVLDRFAPRGGPGVRVEDAPAYPHRGVSLDITRGRVPRTDALIRDLRRLAGWGVNYAQLYIEHVFQFASQPWIGRGCDPLSVRDVLEIDRAAGEAGLSLAPCQATLGHMQPILSQRPARHLAEDLASNTYQAPGFSLPKDRRAWTLTPAREESYDFLSGLVGDLAPLFASPWFHAACDEAYDLGKGQSYALARRLGLGRLFARHVRRVRDLASRHGKRTAIWADMIRHHPAALRHLPPDVILFDWAYHHHHDFDSVADLLGAGFETWVCPGTSSWCSLFPRIHEAFANIQGFAGAGHRHGAAGLVNTDWGDGGHPNLFAGSWPSFAFGAEQAWNPDAPVETFLERFVRDTCGAEDPRSVARALSDLGDLVHLERGGFYQSLWFAIFFAPVGHRCLRLDPDLAWVAERGEIGKRQVAVDADLGRAALDSLEGIRRGFSTMPGGKDDPFHLRDSWVFAADTMAHAARKLMALGPGGRDTRAARRTLARESRDLWSRFTDLWDRDNRLSERKIVEARYRRARESLGM